MRWVIVTTGLAVFITQALWIERYETERIQERVERGREEAYLQIEASRALKEQQGILVNNPLPTVRKEHNEATLDFSGRKILQCRPEDGDQVVRQGIHKVSETPKWSSPYLN